MKHKNYFGTSGIRGKFGEQITPEFALNLGRAVAGSGVKNVIIGRDTRITGRVLEMALVSGLLSGGCHVTNVGIAPTPLVCYGTKKLGKEAGIMITASHNPADYNGFKICTPEGIAYDRNMEKEIETNLALMEAKEQEFSWKQSSSFVEEHDASKEYIKELMKRFSLSAKLRVLIDSANGAAFGISPLLLKKFGYELVSINDEDEGTFPNRLPEPNHANLQITAQLVLAEKCDIAFCHDGDADRMMVIDELGKVVNFDAFLAWLCKKMVEETGVKKIVTTVDASMIIDEYLNKFWPECEIHRTKVGDVFVANKVKETGACFGGEPSGSYIFPEWGLWPDGIYAIFKVLKFLEEDKRPLSEILAGIPKTNHRREKIICSNELKLQVMEDAKMLIPEDCDASFVDGIRMKFEQYIVLIRPSGTEPYVRINVESGSDEKTDELMEDWVLKIKHIIKNLTVENTELEHIGVENIEVIEDESNV